MYFYYYEVKIPNSEEQGFFSEEKTTYPKYSTQILNLANQNAQGTRPVIVGQLSDLIQQFQGSGLAEWREWYLTGHPGAVDKATNRVWKMIDSLKKSVNNIDRDLVKKWVEDLVIVKTFTGLKFQGVIINKISSHLNLEHKLATPEEQSRGIDGYIGNTAVSIKPTTYETKRGLNEEINVPVVYYEKVKTTLNIEFEPADFI